MQFISVFSDIAKFADFRWINDDVSRIQRVLSGDLYIFWVFFTYVIAVQSFIIAVYVWQILRRGGRPFAPPYPWAASKRSILNRVEQSKSFSNFWLLLKEIIPTMFHASSFTTILSWSQQDKKINHHYQLKAWVALGSALITFFHICFDRHCFFICISLKDMKSDIKNCYLTQCFNSVIWHSVS